MIGSILNGKSAVIGKPTQIVMSGDSVFTISISFLPERFRPRFQVGRRVPLLAERMCD